MSRLVIVAQAEEAPHVARGDGRDGWRVFRSTQTEFEVAIPAYQIRRIESIGRRERNEWYALALGEVVQDAEGTHAIIRDFVPNDWAERGRAHVHMSAEAEARVRELGAELHPELRPVGNLHTHPRYTTKPSGTDRKEFWNDPHSVSIIVDPFDSPTIAVYRGRQGERLKEVTSDQSGTAEARQVVPAVAPVPRFKRRSSMRRFLRSLPLVLATFVLAIPLVRVGDRVAELRASVVDLRGGLSALARDSRNQPRWFTLTGAKLECPARVP